MGGIKHLVISGGGHIGLAQCSIVHSLAEQGIIQHKELDSIFATSAGSITAALICMNYTGDEISNYFINRPWQKTLHVGMSEIFGIYNEMGVIDEKFFHTLLEPLLLGKGVSPDINLHQFYEWCGIKLYFYTVDLNTFDVCELSYETYPNLSLVTAITMSSSIPILMKPTFYDGKCFVDGGVLNNYPLRCCFNKTQCKEKQVIGITTTVSDTYNDASNNIINKCQSVTETSNIFDVFMSFYNHYKAILKKQKDEDSFSIPYEIVIPTTGITVDSLYAILQEKDERSTLFHTGKTLAQQFIDNHDELCGVDV